MDPISQATLSSILPLEVKAILKLPHDEIVLDLWDELLSFNRPLGDIYAEIFVQLPLFTSEKFKLLMTRLPSLLVQSSKFPHEQKQLAVALADYVFNQSRDLPPAHILGSLSLAMDYLAKARQIAEHQKETLIIQEIHKKSSSLIYFLIESLLVRDNAFKARIKGSDLERFTKEAARIEALKTFCAEEAHKSSILELYKQAQDAIKEDPTTSFSPEYLEVYKKFKDKSKVPFLLNPEPVTKKYLNAYRAIRASFEALPHTDARIFQGQIFAQYQTFFKILVEDAIAFLGEPPSPYDIRAMGSLSREELCPFSDLEMMILIKWDGENIRRYFKTLCQFLDLQIRSLGESTNQYPLIFSCIHKKVPSGLHLDTGGNPDQEARLINTPQKMAALQSENMSPHSITHTILKTKSLFGNSIELFDKYTKATQAILDVPKEGFPSLRKSRALQLIESRVEDFHQIWPYARAFPSIQNIKTDYVELLNHLLSDMALYFGITDTNTLDIIEKLREKNIFIDQTASLLKEAISQLYKMRCRLHLFYDEQKEIAATARLHRYTSLYQLTREEVKTLEWIRYLLLTPIYALLTKLFHEKDCLIQNENFGKCFQSVDLVEKAFDAYFNDKKSNVIIFSRSLSTALSSIDTLLPSHENYYKKLELFSHHERLEKSNDSVRRTYLENLGASLIIKDSLTQIPNSSGLRQAFLLDHERLIQNLLKITTSDRPKTGTVIHVTHSSFEKTRYLNESIANEILEKEDPKTKGRLKKQYPKSLHNVVAIEHEGISLHFKENPSHPMMEYAIHNLMYRIAGRLTPPSELVRFELEVDGKKMIYPVLISKTIEGQSLGNSALEWNNFTPAQKEQWSWMFLCTLLTRPGDGHRSNYIIDDLSHIFCIDNDISFVEPVASRVRVLSTLPFVNQFLESTLPFVNKFLERKIYFSSALFCLFKEAELSPSVLKAFCELDIDLILNGWIDDIIIKEQIYKNLFSPDELEILFTDDEGKQFKPEILFRKGTLATLSAQFVRLNYYLHERLSRKPHPCVVTSLDLLEQLISLREDFIKDEPVGIYVSDNYKKSFEKPIHERLSWILERDQTKSLSATQCDPICFGKPLTLEAINKRVEYGPERAKEELLFRLICNNSNAISRREVNGKISIKANFKDMDEERQELTLTALTYLNANTLSTKSFSLHHCVILPLPIFQYFLNKELVHLDLRYCLAINNSHMVVIQEKCPQLEELYLSGCDNLTAIQGDSRQSPPSFPHLRKLYVDKCENLQKLFLKAPRLRTLSSKKSFKLTNYYLPHFAFIFNMNIEDCPTYSKILESLAKHLKIEKSVISKMISKLENIPSLSKSDILAITHEGGYPILAEALKFSKTLCTLDLSQTELKDITPLANALRLNKTLTSINLSHNELADVTPLAQALEVNKTLILLNLWQTQLTNVTALGKALKINRALTSIDLGSNKILDITHIAEALKYNEKLSDLDLSHNQITDIAFFAEGLKKNNRLSNLNLSHNLITDITFFAEALKDNKKLSSLDLSNNPLRDSGPHIKIFLVSNIILSILKLSNTGITSTGVQLISEALILNKTLASLDLSSNLIKNAEAKKIATALAQNKGLSSLNLEDNQIARAGGEALLELLKANQRITCLSLDKNLIKPSLLLNIKKTATTNKKEREEKEFSYLKR